MFKYDKNTIPYHISNFVFYLFTIMVIALIFYYAFIPPLVDVTTADFFASLGVREIGGIFFFLIVLLVPLSVIYGAVYHLYKLITFNRQSDITE